MGGYGPDFILNLQRGTDMIYLDNAATTLKKPDRVAEAVADAIGHLGNSGRGAGEASMDASRMIYGTREKLTKLFGGEDPRQAVFTSNGTESLNTAICGLFGPGDHVITTVLEHNSVLRPFYFLEKQGLFVSFLPCDDWGRPCYDKLKSLLRKNTKGIVCTHASNVTGNMVDLELIGRFCKEHGLLLVVDASQTAGNYPLDMEKINADVVCFTGHKGLMGPQGTGGLLVKKGVEISPLKRGGSGVHSYLKDHPEEMPVRLEAGTLNGHGIAGLSAALDFILETGVENIHQKEMSLVFRFYEEVKNIPQVKVYGDFSTRERGSIVGLNIGDYDSSKVSDELQYTYGISTRPGAHCAPLMHEALHTVSQGIVRFSFSWFNTGEEVEEAVRAVAELAKD